MGYLGSKTASGVPQAIIGLMPPHDFYVEPFAGTAAIFWAKGRAHHSVLIEKDADQAAALSMANHSKFSPVEIYEADGLQYLAMFEPEARGRVLIYCNPPYLLSTRTSSKRYRHEFSEADHLALAASLSRLAEAGCAIIVSGYPSKLYDALYAGWNTREMQAMTRGGVRTEKLWFNFDPGAAHWHTFAGRDRTDRQRIKRKAERWAARYAELPPAERQAVLAAILAAGDRSQT